MNLTLLDFMHLHADGLGQLAFFAIIGLTVIVLTLIVQWRSKP